MASADTTLEKEVSKLFRVRKTILQLLRDRGYAVMEDDKDLNLTKDEFERGFMNANYNRDWLTMLKQRHNDATDQIYVFFPDETRGKALGVKPIANQAQRMERDGVNRALLILQTGLTPYARDAVEKVNHAGRFRIEVFLENELFVNITLHQLVPAHTVLTPEEKKALLLRYKLKESQLPRIQKTDPIARYYGLAQGQIVKIMRPSETAGRYVTYRLCVG